MEEVQDWEGYIVSIRYKETLNKIQRKFLKAVEFKVYDSCTAALEKTETLLFCGFQIHSRLFSIPCYFEKVSFNRFCL